MTTPTQAQIEAVALLLRVLALAKTGHWRDRTGLSLEAHPIIDDIRALTAAAEAEQIERRYVLPDSNLLRTGGYQPRPTTKQTAATEAGDIEDCDGDLAEIEQIAESRDNIALTAAAEVGKPKGMIEEIREQIARWKQGKRIGFGGAIDDLVAEEHAATIERCAQVALEWLRENGYELSHLELIAAIRKLKD